MDEPSTGLAPLIVRDIFQIIVRLQDEGNTVLLVEQNVVQSLALANRAYVLENGRVALSGAAADLANDPELQKTYLGL